MRVQSWSLTDLSGVKGTGKNRLHGRRTRIIGKPLDLHIWTKPLLKPTFTLACKRVGNYSLGMGNIRKMSETNHGFLFRAADLRRKRK